MYGEGRLHKNSLIICRLGTCHSIYCLVFFVTNQVGIYCIESSKNTYYSTGNQRQHKDPNTPNAMSAYGTIAVTSGPLGLLPSTSWDLPPPSLGRPTTPFRRLVLHHLRLDSARTLPGLFEYTHRIFAAEVEAGRTYPQEAHATVAAAAASVGVGSGDSDAKADTHAYAYSRAAFEAYFWAADVFVAIGMMDDAADVVGGGDLDVGASRGGRSWEEALVGFYYVKPNYPGRSSHVSEFLLQTTIYLYKITAIG